MMNNNLKVGKQIQNGNGYVYTVLAVNEDRALLVGGHDYVVINDLKYFEESGHWGNGTYFPFFEDSNSTKMLDRALYYFKNYNYKPYDEEDEDVEGEN